MSRNIGTVVVPGATSTFSLLLKSPTSRATCRRPNIPGARGLDDCHDSHVCPPLLYGHKLRVSRISTGGQFNYRRTHIVLPGVRTSKRLVSLL